MALYLPYRHSSIESFENWRSRQATHTNALTETKSLPTSVCLTLKSSEYPNSQGISKCAAFNNTNVNTNQNYQAFLAPADTFIGSYCGPEQSSLKTRGSICHKVFKKLNISTNSANLVSTNDVCVGDTHPNLQWIPGDRSSNMKSLHDMQQAMSLGYTMLYGRAIHSPCLQLEGLRYERNRLKTDLKQTNVVADKQHSTVCTVPLPDSLLLEPGYIHRRNERERDRVRSLNEGYDRLKQSLPLRNKDKRISKVDTLRIAIRYIRQLRKVLGQTEIINTSSISDICEELSEDTDSNAEKDTLSRLVTQFDEIDEEDSCGKDDDDDDKDGFAGCTLD